MVATGSVLLRFVDREQRPVAGVASAQLHANGRFVATVPPSDEGGRSRVDGVEAGGNRLVALPRRFGAAKTAFGKIYAEHPDEPDIVERTLLDLGPIVVAPGAAVEQTIVLPDLWFRW